MVLLENFGVRSDRLFSLILKCQDEYFVLCICVVPVEFAIWNWIGFTVFVVE